MLKKLNNKQLLLILIVFLGIYGIMRYIRDKKGENTFHTHIIPKIDSSKVNVIFIYPKAHKKPVRFDLKGTTWMVSQNGIVSRADQKSERYIIQQLQQISPDRLATNDPAQWKDYDVNDSLGTRVVLLNNKDTLLDVIVGRFSYIPQQRQALSCVRIHGQNEVYSVDGFLSMNIADDFTSWRDRTLMPDQPQLWTKLTYTYPGDSSYMVTKDSGSGWVVDGQKPDSATTANLIRNLSMQNYGNFIKGKFDTNSTQPLYTLKIESSASSPVIIKAYPADTVNKFVVVSSSNPWALMNGNAQDLFKKIFLAKKAFFEHPAKPKAPKPERNGSK